MDYQRELRLQRAAERLCLLPPRIIYELLQEIGSAHDISSDVLQRSEAFAGITPDVLRAIGGDRFPRSIRQVG